MLKSNSSIQSAALTIDESADYLRVSRGTIWRLLKNKSLPRVRIGARTVIRRADLDAFLTKLAEVA
jgi:excisionase family DNA binding protein